MNPWIEDKKITEPDEFGKSYHHRRRMREGGDQWYIERREWLGGDDFGPWSPMVCEMLTFEVKEPRSIFKAGQ